MRKIYALLFIAFSFFGANAQNVTVNPGGGSYATLQAAFAAINAGTHTGAVTVSIIANTTETAPAVLNASTAPANYTSVTISPSGGVARTISGSFAGALIDFNGADNVNINGLNTGGNSLIIDNTNTGGTSSTILFRADATNNTVQNSTIKGASAAIATGTIVFSTGTTTGNDGNTVTDKCYHTIDHLTP